MANQPNMQVTRKKIQTLLDLPDGRSVLLGTYEQMEEVQDDGSINESTIAHSRVMADNSVWNTSALADGAKRPVPIGLCSQCAKKKGPGGSVDHALVPLSSSKLCHRCRKRICPTHSCPGGDGKYRCPSCARWYWLFSWIRPLFFELR